jgi:tRNA pseudouridine(38-40) synthase
LVAVEARRAGFHTHARALGVGKRYRYRLVGDRPDEALELASLPRPRPGRPAPRPAPPVWRTWQVAPPLDLAPMRAAAALLVGAHDFRAFASGPFGDQPTTRRVHQLTIEPAAGPQGPHLVVEVLGDGFLRNMVRVIVGSLAEVGAGLRPPAQLLEPLGSGLRDDAGLTAPARALTLVDLLEVEPPEGGAPWAPRVDPAA